VSNIENIDANFKIESKVEADGVCWFDAASSNFQIHGLQYDSDGYKRMDTQVACNVNEGIKVLHRHTSGGRLTFETDSPYIAIHAVCEKTQSVTMSLSGRAGFDMYLDRDKGLEFENVFAPPIHMVNNFEGIYYFREQPPHKVVLHFPLYNGVQKLYIGVKEGALLRPYSPYLQKAPVVFYGSSITQGGCVSRPGNSYPAIYSRISRNDFICLGFSGSAHGEEAMAQYIASLPMSMFVLDYDHNDCDNLSRLQEQHELFYKTVRRAHPDIPIIIMSAPYAARTFYRSHPANSKKILMETFKHAKTAGELVGFIDGETVFGEDRDAALADRIHPNDLGHLKMAHSVLRCARMLESCDAAKKARDK